MRTALLDDGQRQVQPRGQVPRPAHTADVGRDHDGILRAEVLPLEIVEEDVPGRQLVRGNGEKALDLPSMQIERQKTVGSGRGDQVGHQPGCDRHPRLVLFVGAAIAVVGHHRRDASGRVAAQRVDEDQQLHQVIVDRRRRGLDQEDILAAHALVQAHKGVAVGELKDVGAAQRHAQIVGDLLRQVAMGRAAVDRQIAVELVLGHGWLNNRGSLFSCAFAAPAIGLGAAGTWWTRVPHPR